MDGQALTPQAANRSRPEEHGSEPPAGWHRGFPVGAEVCNGKGAHFRVWAPESAWASVSLSGSAEFSADASREIALAAEGDGYFSGWAAGAQAGMYYKIRLQSGCFPDPASRFQPLGPHGPSQLIDARCFAWTDQDWRGVPRSGQVIYETHVGTFTPEGTWRAAQEQLAELAELGITVVEVMPVAEFPGNFGWGYDGVDLYAPTRLYGTPDDFRAFVCRAHELGLGVILDVVYNHIGPDGNYLKHFARDYFTSRYGNEWGEALNFDGPNSGPVREFFSTNAAYWVKEFHLDGLRLDAVHQIFDTSPEHVLRLISERSRQAANGRRIYLVAENEKQQARVVRPLERAGYGLDAVWNDDFHHMARAALTGRHEAYYGDYSGAPQEFISAVKRGYLYQGQWYSWQQQPRGTPALDLEPEQFINFLQNHDQVANSLRGVRLHALSSPGAYRALTALLLLAPGTPMLFQGQEFAASAPFLFFADHKADLARLVAKGRLEFLSQFPSVASPESQGWLKAPDAAETFAACKLKLAERALHAEAYCLHRDLLRLRREDPVFSRGNGFKVDGAVLGPEAFGLRFFEPAGNDRLLLINLGLDLVLRSMAEPLLAPTQGSTWRPVWSSEDPRYGGGGIPPFEARGQWQLLGQAALVLESAAVKAEGQSQG